MQDLIGSPENHVPCGKHARRVVAHSTHDPFGDGPIQIQSLPALHQGASNLNLSSRTRPDRISEADRMGSPGRHQRDSWGVGVMQVHSSATDSTDVTVPMAEFTYDADTWGVSGNTQVAGLKALLAISMLAHDVPGIPELPSFFESATVCGEGQLSTMSRWRSRYEAVQPMATVPISESHYETSSATTLTSTCLQHLKPRRIEAELRSAVAYENRLAVKGLLSLTFVILLLVIRVYFD